MFGYRAVIVASALLLALVPNVASAQQQQARPPVIVTSTYDRNPSSPNHNAFTLVVRATGVTTGFRSRPNMLRSITVTQVRNAAVAFPDDAQANRYTTTTPYTWRADSGRPQDTQALHVRRTKGTPIFLTIIVTDDYGTWSTFYGAP